MDVQLSPVYPPTHAAHTTRDVIHGRIGLYDLLHLELMLTHDVK